MMLELDIYQLSMSTCFEINGAKNTTQYTDSNDFPPSKTTTMPSSEEKRSLLLRPTPCRTLSQDPDIIQPLTHPFLVRPILLVVLISFGIIIGAVWTRAKQQHHPLDLLTKSIYYKRKDPSTECEEDTRYSKHTLKRAYELPYAALFRDTRGQSTFEASDVTIVNDTVYSVCDNSWAISKFGRDLDPFSMANVQIGDTAQEGEFDSGYEAIFEYGGLFYLVRESVDHGMVEHTDRKRKLKGKAKKEYGDYHAIIEELSLKDDTYTFVRDCRCEFAFEGTSKGFEGAVGFPDGSGNLYIVALCEGNHCSEDKQKRKDVGNGRVVLMRKKMNDPVKDKEYACLWETVKIVKIPNSASFLDYSAIDITSNGRVAVTSQEDSAVWLGHASGIVNGVIDPDAFEFQDAKEDYDDSSSVLSFPKDGGCHTVYCNIEGIHFINDEMLMAVSDKMKSGGRQDYRCQEKDQSIHAFVIP